MQRRCITGDLGVERSRMSPTPRGQHGGRSHLCGTGPTILPRIGVPLSSCDVGRPTSHATAMVDRTAYVTNIGQQRADRCSGLLESSHSPCRDEPPAVHSHDRYTTKYLIYTAPQQTLQHVLRSHSLTVPSDNVRTFPTARPRANPSTQSSR
jgi:hypothetical protein